MGRTKPKPTPEAVILPPDLDDDDDEQAGGGIPDDDGWIHLDGTERKEKPREEAKPKRRSARRRT